MNRRHVGRLDLVGVLVHAVFRSSFLVCLAAPTLLAGAAGCGAPASADHDDEAEHHVPEHRPGSYRELTEALHRRIDQLRSADRFPTDADRRVLQEQLSDLLRWIPEIAAESDLRRDEWEEVRRIGRELERAYQRNVRESAASSESPPRLAADAEIDRGLEALCVYRAAAERDSPSAAATESTPP